MLETQISEGIEGKSTSLQEGFLVNPSPLPDSEKRIGSSFGGPDKIPAKYYKGEYPLITDVVKYANSKYEQGKLFEDNEATTCMSYYGLCE